MSVNLSLFAGAGAQFFDDNGVPLAGGLIYTYAAGTTSPLTTYTSISGVTPLPNPIVLNAAGRVPTGEIWVTAGVTYKFVVYTSENVLVASYDNVNGTYIATDLADTFNPVNGDALIGFRQSNSSGNLGGAVGRTVHQKFQEHVSIKDFGAIGNGSNDDTPAFNAAIAYANSVVTGVLIYVPAGTYIITSNTAVISAPMSWVGDGRATSKLFFRNCNGFNYNLSALSALNVSSKISDLFFGTNTTGYIGFSYTGNDTYGAHDANLQFDNCQFNSERIFTSSVSVTAEWNYAVYLLSADGTLFTNSYFQGSTNNNTYAGLTTSTGLYLKNSTLVVLKACSFYDFGTGVQVEGQSEGLFANQCTFVALGYGVKFTNLVSPSNNHVLTQSTWGSYTREIYFQTVLAGSANNAEGNYIADNFFLEREPNVSKTDYAAIEANVRYSSIHNNMCQSNNTLTPLTYGIIITQQGNTLNNNQFFNKDYCYNIIDAGDGRYTVANSGMALNGLTATSTGATTKFVENTYLAEVAAASTNYQYAYSYVLGDLNRYNLATFISSAIRFGDNRSGNQTKYTDFFSNSLSFTASCSGTTLSTTGSPALAVGYTIYSSTGVSLGTVTSGSGNSWVVSIGGTYASQTMTAMGTESYDTRILSIGGSYSVTGQGLQYLYGASHKFSGIVEPQVDNTVSLGESSYRWSVVYAATGAINTSDERVKEQITSINDLVLDAWETVEWCQFKYKDAVAKKGDNARLHVGVIAQQVKSAFEAKGLDAFEYGILCYDTWNAEKEKRTDEGELISAAKEAGDLYSIRYEEALALEAALMRRELKKLKS